MKEPAENKGLFPERELPAITNRQIVAQSRLFKVEALNLTFTNGEERIYERIPGGSRNAVMIVPVIDDSIVLIREYAAGTHAYEVGFPKGLVDAGETDAEAANRELQEEIGMAAGSLTFLKSVSLAPGFMNAKMSLFVAKDLTPSQLQGDEPEPLEMIHWPLTEAEALLDHPEFHESRSMTALLLFLRQQQLTSSD